MPPTFIKKLVLKKIFSLWSPLSPPSILKLVGLVVNPALKNRYQRLQSIKALTSETQDGFNTLVCVNKVKESVLNSETDKLKNPLTQTSGCRNLGQPREHWVLYEAVYLVHKL